MMFGGKIFNEPMDIRVGYYWVLLALSVFGRIVSAGLYELRPPILRARR